MEPSDVDAEPHVSLAEIAASGRSGHRPRERTPSRGRTRAQPAAAEDPVITLAALSAVLEKALAPLFAERDGSRTPRAASRPRAPPPPPPPPQDDIARFLAMNDAVRGVENPTWRLCKGLSLSTFLQEKFTIFSIPHLLHHEVDGAMIRVPVGSALRAYRAMLPNCKLQFPNQIQVRATGKDAKTTAFHEENAAGTRAQIERAERMFLEILEELDQRPSRDFPASKKQWTLAIDIGAELLEHYATLAFGYPKGGAKVSVAHAASFALGKFDPAKLWETAEKSFRS